MRDNYFIDLGAFEIFGIHKNTFMAIKHIKNFLLIVEKDFDVFNSLRDILTNAEKWIRTQINDIFLSHENIICNELNG